MVATQQTFSGILQKFNAEHKAKGSAIVTRDGLPVASAIPACVNRETFAAMSATMVGAAETAAAELQPVTASDIVARFGNLSLVAVAAGRDVLVVSLADGQGDLGRLIAATHALADQVRDAV